MPAETIETTETTETLEARVARLESKIREVEERLSLSSPSEAANKGGWRSFVGIHANNPRFEEAVRSGRAWRNADSPADNEDNA
jgi:hypothetical protein